MDALESKIQVLSHQNQRLAVQLEEKRQNTKLLEDRVAALEGREQQYGQTLLCVNRLWQQLHNDLQHMATLASTKLADGMDALSTTTGCTSDGTAKGQQVSAGTQRDPFLARLLHHASGGAAGGAVAGLSSAPAGSKQAQDASRQLEQKLKQLEASRTDVEAGLHQRAAATQATFASLLDAIQRLYARSQGQGEPAGGGSSSAAEEAASLRLALSGSYAAQRAAAEQLAMAEDRWTEAEDRIKKLQNELADMEQALSSTQKRYAALKEGQGQVLEQQGQLQHQLSLKQEGVPSASLTPGQALTPGQGLMGMTSVGTVGSASVGAGPGVGGPVGAQGSEGGAEEVPVLQKLLEQRGAELSREKEAHLKTKRELSEAQAKLGDELWVAQTRTHQQLLAEVQSLNEALAAKGRDMDTLARERDEMAREAALKAQYMQAEAQIRQKVAWLDKVYRDACTARMESERQRAELHVQLVREQERGVNVQTAAEFKALVATLQGQVAALQARVKLSQVTQERLDAGAAEVQAAQARVEARAAEVQRAMDRLRRKDLELEEQRRREQALKDRLHELKAFVEVLTVFCKDPRDVADVRASEAALKDQNATLKAQLEGHPLQQRVRELEAAALASRDQLELAAVETDEVRLALSTAQGQERELRQQLAAAREECQLYIAEMETMGTAYEELQSQNTRLLQKLSEGDEARTQLMAERLKLMQSQQLLQEQFERQQQEGERLGRECADQRAAREGLEKEVARLAGDIVALKEQVRQQAGKTEAALTELKRREEGIALHQTQLSGLQQQLADVRAELEAAHDKLVKESSKRHKAEEEGKVLSTRLERARKAAAAASSNAGGLSANTRELHEEIDAMRQLLNCNVCHERQKNVIITKCCHVFCNKCIQRNIESRNRKCPGCGVPFGQADVKQFYYT